MFTTRDLPKEKAEIMEFLTAHPWGIKVLERLLTEAVKQDDLKEIAAPHLKDEGEFEKGMRRWYQWNLAEFTRDEDHARWLRLTSHGRELYEAFLATTQK